MNSNLLGFALTSVLLLIILKTLKTIMATQAQGAEDLKAVSAKLQKIGNESATLLQKITALEEAAANSGDTSPEMQAAIDDVKAQAQIVDDLVPDAVEPPPPPPDEPPVEPTAKRQ